LIGCITQRFCACVAVFAVDAGKNVFIGAKWFLELQTNRRTTSAKVSGNGDVMVFDTAQAGDESSETPVIIAF
jgi:hypothetical protein